MSIAYRPIDAAAMDGKHHLVRDCMGHLWSACFTFNEWRCGKYPIETRIVEYATREPNNA